MDVTGQGEITIIEFERMFDDEEMKAFFQSIEINAVDAWTLFDSLDVNGDHTISLEVRCEETPLSCMTHIYVVYDISMLYSIKEINILNILMFCSSIGVKGSL